MKKLTIVAALLLFAGIVFGQTLQKGNLVGVHVLKVELKPGATMDQYMAFLNEKFKPVWEKEDKNMKIYMLEAIRGENNDEIGMIVIYKDEAARNKYYNEDGSPNEFYEKILEKMASVTAEGEKIGTWTSTYTDWVVQ